jgi:hypothetical protein
MDKVLRVATFTFNALMVSPVMHCRQFRSTIEALEVLWGVRIPGTPAQEPRYISRQPKVELWTLKTEMQIKQSQHLPEPEYAK